MTVLQSQPLLPPRHGHRHLCHHPMGGDSFRVAGLQPTIGGQSFLASTMPVVWDQVPIPAEVQERHWCSFPPQGESKMVSTISTAPAGQRGGVSTLPHPPSI
jgi:hypothetical protein